MRTKKVPIGNHRGFALVDERDFNLVSKFHWNLHSSGYAYTRARKGGKNIYMHRLVAKASARQKINHRDGNPLNNVRSNLRISNQSLSLASGRGWKNNSGYRGVYCRKDSGKFQVKLKVKGRQIRLGTYVDPVEAAQAYDKAALEYFGEFARLNFSIGTRRLND